MTVFGLCNRIGFVPGTRLIDGEKPMRGCWIVPFALWGVVVMSVHGLDTKGLVGLWLFDEGAGKVAKDTSGNDNDAQLDADAKWTEGKFGKALLTLPQTASTVPVSDSLNTVADAISVGGWFRIDKDSDTGLRRDSAYLLEDQAGGEQNPEGWVVGIWLDGAIALAWGQKKVPQAEWTHIAATYNGSVIALWVNGEPDTTTNAKGKVGKPGNVLNLGKFAAESYTGGLDEAFLFNRALSQAELKEVMRGFTTAAVAAQGKLATHWAMLKR